MDQQRKAAGGIAVALACAAAAPAPAQDAGGMLWQFSVSDRLGYATNPGLAPGGDAARATNTLSLGTTFSSETRTEKLVFGLSTGLRSEAGDDRDGIETSLSAPRATLSYSRSTAAAALNVSASLTRDEVEFLRSAADFVNEEGEVELPDDFEDLTGTGTRTQRNLQASLRWGEDAPVGYALSLGLSELDYTDVTDPDLVDSRTISLGASVRLSLSEVLDANLSWSGRRFEEDAPGAAPVESQTWRLGFSLDRPQGAITTGLSLSGDDRITLDLGRSLDLPAGRLSVSAGISGQRGGPFDPVGRIGWQQDLPAGSLSLNASQSFSTDADGDQTRITSLAASYSQSITETTSLSLGLNYGARTALATDASIRTASLQASYNWRVTEDWALQAGASAALREEEGSPRARSDSLFLGLSRSFSFRP